MEYAFEGAFGGPRFYPSDVKVVKNTDGHEYLSDAVIAPASFIYNREAFVRHLPVVTHEHMSLMIPKSMEEILEQSLAILGPRRNSNVWHSSVNIAHLDHILIPIFEPTIYHWVVADVQPQSNIITVFDSLRPPLFYQRKTTRLNMGGNSLSSIPFNWQTRQPGLLRIIQEVEALRIMEKVGLDLDEALTTANSTRFNTWYLIERAHQSPQASGDCGIMTLMYMRAVCKGKITNAVSNIEGGWKGHEKRDTVHDHLLAWNLRGLERLDEKYIHHTPMVILREVLMKHVISDDESKNLPLSIVCIVNCSPDIETLIVKSIFHILWLAGFTDSELDTILTIHRARNLEKNDRAWKDAVLYVHLFTNSFTAYERDLRSNIDRLVTEAYSSTKDVDESVIYPLTVISGFLYDDLLRTRYFPHTCLRAWDGTIKAHEGRERCSSWYISCLSSFTDTYLSEKRGCTCTEFVGLPSGLHIPRVEEYHPVMIEEWKYMSVGLARDPVVVDMSISTTAEDDPDCVLQTIET